MKHKKSGWTHCDCGKTKVKGNVTSTCAQCKETIYTTSDRYLADGPYDTYTACSIAEGFDGGNHTMAEVHDAWQSLVDSGAAWTLQGWYGRNAQSLIERGVIKAK